MANERTNQFKILLSDEEKAWLEEVATARGLTSSDLLRQYIREAHADIELRKRRLASDGDEDDDDFRWKEWHNEILGILAKEQEPIAKEDLAQEMPPYQNAFWKAQFPRALNQLVRNGYARRLTTGYEITDKGRIALG